MSVVAESAKVELLPKQYKGELIPVGELSPKMRRRIGLSNEDTIQEIIGDALVDEAVEYCHRAKVIGFDTETGGEEKEDGLNPWKGRIVIVQMGDLDRQYLVWWQTLSPEAQQKILDLYGDPKVAKVGLNLKFDAGWILVKHGMKARGWNLVDVMLIEQILNCGLFGEGDDSVGTTLHLSGMQQQARRWLGLDLPKDEDLRTGWAQMTPGEWWAPVLDAEGRRVYENGRPKTRSLLQKKFYAADDVIIPLLLARKQKPWIKRFGLVETVNLENAFLPVLAEMEVRGMRINLEKWDVLAREAEEKLKAAKRALDKLFDVTVTITIDEEGRATRTRDKNYASGPALKDLVREYMAREHEVDVVLTNKHLRESLEKKGINPDRIQKLFEDAAKEAEKLYKESRKKKEKTEFGTPTSNDIVAILWPKVRRYLGRAFYMLDTESKSFKLYRILGETPEYEVDETLPTSIGFPADLTDAITDFRKYSKSLGTYGYNWHHIINPATGRLHCEFVQGALTTGRISSRPNFQNIPADERYRDCFEASPGYKIVGADWDQVEPRIIAHLSDCFAYKRVFFSRYPDRPEFQVYCRGVTEALDLYTEIGKIVGVIPEWMTVRETKGDEDAGIEPTAEGKKGRKQSKIIVLGLGYGTGKKKFHITLIIDTGEHHAREYSDQLFDRYWESVPEVKKTLDEFSNLASPEKSKRRIWHPYLECDVTWSETVGGRKRFFRPTSLSSWTEGRNHPIQGGGADVMKKTSVLLARWAWENDIDGGLVNLVHDEPLSEVRADQAEIYREKKQEIMQMVGESYYPSVPIPSAGYVADVWKK